MCTKGVRGSDFGAAAGFSCLFIEGLLVGRNILLGRSCCVHWEERKENHLFLV